MHTSKNKHLDKIDSYEKASYVHFPCFLQDFKYTDIHLNGSQSQHEAQKSFLMNSHVISLISKIMLYPKATILSSSPPLFSVQDSLVSIKFYTLRYPDTSGQELYK